MFVHYFTDLIVSVLRLPPLLSLEELPRELVGVEGGRDPACFLAGLFLLPLLVKEVLLPRGLVPGKKNNLIKSIITNLSSRVSTLL